MGLIKIDELINELTKIRETHENGKVYMTHPSTEKIEKDKEFKNFNTHTVELTQIENVYFDKLSKSVILRF